MQDNYIFPAIFSASEDGISIYFPDLSGCLPCADNFETAFRRAKEALQLHLFGMEEDNEEIPTPTPVSEIKLNSRETLAMIEVWMPPFREKMFNQSVRKTVTLPRWLDTIAQKEQINYSHFLKKTLKNYLGVSNSFDEQNYFG